MTFAVVRSKDFWTPQRRLAAGEDEGRRPGRLPGGHVGDIADLQKSLLFCLDCKKKFNHVKAGYVMKRNLPVVRGWCDGCGQYTPNGRLLVHHTMANIT